MANALYDTGRAAFLNADVDWTADEIRVVLTRTYVPNMATDQFLSIIPAGNRVATSGAFTGKTSTAGVADADDVTYTAVTAGAACDRLVLYKWTGSDATSQLIGMIDTATGLPVTPNGGDIVVSWDNGTNRIFKL